MFLHNIQGTEVTSTLLIAPSPPANSNPVLPGDDKWTRRQVIRRGKRKEGGRKTSFGKRPGEKLRDKRRRRHSKLNSRSVLQKLTCFS